MPSDNRPTQRTLLLLFEFTVNTEHRANCLRGGKSGQLSNMITVKSHGIQPLQLTWIYNTYRFCCCCRCAENGCAKSLRVRMLVKQTTGSVFSIYAKTIVEKRKCIQFNHSSHGRHSKWHTHHSWTRTSKFYMMAITYFTFMASRHFYLQCLYYAGVFVSSSGYTGCARP